MEQDIRKRLKNEQHLSKQRMPKGHQERFLTKLDEQFPKTVKKSSIQFRFLNIAASLILLLGFSYVMFQVFQDKKNDVEPTVVEQGKSLNDISPQLKKVEDYYLANINMELSKLKVTPKTKALFDSYLIKLEELNKAYSLLEQELFESGGPNPKTVNALIDNLKLRLNLLHRLKEQLNDVQNLNNQNTDLKTII